MQETKVYDLGDVDAARSRSAPLVSESAAKAELAVGGALAPPRLRARQIANHRWRPGPALSGSASILLPGSGQILAGKLAWGFFFLTWLVLVGALGWAVLVTFDRLARTLELVGAPAQIPVLVLAVLYILAAGLHVGGVLQAQDIGALSDRRRAPHPVLAAAASFLVPGWGQVLNGHRIRSAIFLGGLWGVMAAWSVLLPPVQRMVAGSAVLSGSIPAWKPGLLLTATAVLWSLAVYDAAAGALARRHAA